MPGAAAVDLGHTRADDALALKVDEDGARVRPALVA